MRFYRPPLSPALAQWHLDLGGSDLERLAAELPDGVLRVMAGREPVAPGLRLMHVSVSVGASGDPGARCVRRPTDDECRQACQQFRGYQWDEETSGSGITRHFWEVTHGR